MKLSKKILLTLSLATLTACSDAVTKVNKANDVLMKVGKNTITKGELYTSMKQAFGASTVNSMAIKQIAALEVPVNEEMKKAAKDTLNNYKKLYGDSFKSYLSNTKMTEDQYLNDYLIPSQQAQKLAEKYILANFSIISKKYQPVQASVIIFKDEKKANEALTELKKANANIEEIAKKYNSTNKFIKKIFTLDSKEVDSLVRNAIQSQKKELGWTLVKSSDGVTFNLVLIDSKDVNKLQKEITEHLKKDSSITADANTFYFKKYNFHVYDKVVYDALKADFPNIVIQGKK